MISGSKIEPLDASLKRHVSHDASDGGSSGTDFDIDHSRIEPLTPQTTREHPPPHATAGAIGSEGILAGSKIDPLAAQIKANTTTDKRGGLNDEAVDAARIKPLGDIRE